MSGRLEGILPEDEQQALAQIIDKIGTEKPDLAEAIRLCAIPHWFNKEILALLRGEGSKPSELTETLLDELRLKRLAFVRSGNLVLHDNVRKLLLNRWRKENPEHSKRLSGMAAAYYEDKLQQSVLSDEQRAEWEREEMYHLLVANKERGIDRFKSLCNKAIDSFRLSTLDLLLCIASEQSDDLSPEIQLWIQFFEGKKNQLSSDWERALEVWERLKGERAFFTVDLEQTLAVHLSILYKDTGEWNKAIECLEDSLNILEKEGDERGMITLLNNQGYLYKDREHLQKAENDFQRALEVSKKIGDDRGMAVSLKNLGLLYKDNMKWDEALEHLGSSLAILERIADERGMARAYDDRGLLYKDRGLLYKDRDDLQKAENDFQRAQEILDEVGDEHEKAAAFNSLGLLYKDRGLLYKDGEDLQKAENDFQRAREILERIGDQRRIADIFNYLGFLYTAEMEWHDVNTNFQRALTNFQEALKILKEMSDERGTAVILSNLGLLYQRKGEQQQAADSFQQSLDIVEQVGDEMNAATTMYELALLYDAMGKYDKAIELLEKVLKISERVGHPDSRIRKSREKLEMVKAKATSSESASDQ
jgi:tetratricopeptide (TPR) repeat protein